VVAIFIGVSKNIVRIILCVSMRCDSSCLCILSAQGTENLAVTDRYQPGIYFIVRVLLNFQLWWCKMFYDTTFLSLEWKKKKEL